jgi:predicted nucleic acid-binding protein
MMDLIIDASSIINLHNAKALDLVTGLDEHTFWVSPLVVGECEPTCAAELLQLQGQGLVGFVEPNEISSDTYLDLLNQHELGEGETECIALAMKRPYAFCCDDRKARQVATAILGSDKVIGSLRLLKWSVTANLLGAADAVGMYEAMKTAGGFLPEIPEGWFASNG